jgi:hypothetical protein
MSKRDQRFRGGSAHAADSLPIEEVEARAARLGITPSGSSRNFARLPSPTSPASSVGTPKD